jgi:hypothetical protein
MLPSLKVRWIRMTASAVGESDSPFEPGRSPGDASRPAEASPSQAALRWVSDSPAHTISGRVFGLAHCIRDPGVPPA